MPFPGSVLEQPLGLIVMGARLLTYAKAHAMYVQDPAHAPGPVRDLVLLTAKASAEMRLGL